MKARYFVVVGGAVLAMATWGIVACSFGPAAYSGPDPLTPEEAGMAPQGDDGSASAEDGASNESSSVDSGASGDGGVSDSASSDSAPGDSAPTDGTPTDIAPTDSGPSDGLPSDTSSDNTPE
jgi:hypothetical protein